MVKTRGTSGQASKSSDNNGPSGSLQKSRGKATAKVPLEVSRQQKKKLLQQCLEDIKTKKLTQTQAQNRYGINRFKLRRLLADAAAAAAGGDGQDSGATLTAAFDAVLEVPSPVPLRPGAQVKPRFITGAEMAVVLRRRAVEREMKEILAGARQYFRDLSPDSKRELKASEKAAKDKVYDRNGGASSSAGNDAVRGGNEATRATNRSRGQVSGKRGRSAGRQESAAEAEAGALGGAPRPRRATQVPLRYRQSADLGGGGNSPSSEQNDTVSETSSETASSESED